LYAVRQRLRLNPAKPADWLIVGIGFVTMGVGVTARTAFSLLMPPLIDEFGWQRGLAAGAQGPRVVILTGVLLTTAGLLLAPAIERPWHLYATLGVLCVARCLISG
jgi:hypothetical protein